MFLLFNLCGWLIVELGLAPVATKLVEFIDMICMELGVYGW